MLVCSCYHTVHPGPSCLTNRNFFLEVQDHEARNFFSSEGSLPGLQRATFSVCGHTTSSLHKCGESIQALRYPFLKDTNPIGPALLTTFNFNYLLTPDAIILQVRSSRREFWRRHNSVPNSPHFGLYSQISRARTGLKTHFVSTHWPRAAHGKCSFSKTQCWIQRSSSQGDWLFCSPQWI